MIRAAPETTFLMVNIIVQNHFRVIWFKYHCLYESLIRTNKSIHRFAFSLYHEHGTSQPGYFRIAIVLLLIPLHSGQSHEPEALFTGAHRQTRVCEIEVGLRVQRVSRQHGWLHEPPGEIFVISCVIYHLTIFAACKHGGVPRWRIKGCSW